MKITPDMKEEVLTDGVYALPDGRVFRAQPLPYFRQDEAERKIVPQVDAEKPKAFTVDYLESVIAVLLTFDALENYGALYVNGQLEWAEAELQKLLASQGSSMAKPAAQQGGQAIVAR